MSRTIQMVAVFQEFRSSARSEIQRLRFAQQCAEFSQRPENAEKMIQLGVVVLLRDLLRDSSASIQQSAAVTVGRLASHSSKIADLMVKQDIIRIILYFNMDKSNKSLKRAALMAIRGVVRHNAQLARSVIDIGGLNQIVASLEDLDPGVKEAAAWVCGCIALHEISTAHSIIGAGAVPLLILCLQEPEVNVRAAAASNTNPNLKRQALNALVMVAKHAMEVIIEADIIQLVLEHCGHTDEHVRASACALVRDIVKHSPELAQLVTEAGGLGVLVSAVVRNTGKHKIPGIMALGFIGSHNAELALSVVQSKGIEALNMSMEQATEGSVVSAVTWALGHIAQHGTEHAKHVTPSGILNKTLPAAGIANQQASENVVRKRKTGEKLEQNVAENNEGGEDGSKNDLLIVSDQTTTLTPANRRSVRYSLLDGFRGLRARAPHYDQKLHKEAELIVIIVVGLLVAAGPFVLSYYFNELPSNEISWKEMVDTILPGGGVEKLEVMNNKKVRVHLVPVNVESEEGVVENLVAKTKLGLWFGIGGPDYFRRDLADYYAHANVEPAKHVLIYFKSESESEFDYNGLLERLVELIIFMGKHYIN